RRRFDSDEPHAGHVRIDRGARAKGWLAAAAMVAATVTSFWSSPWASTMLSRAPSAQPGGGPPAACPYRAGARVAETLGVTPADGRAIPITHVIVLMQENRSFDHYFGKLAASGQPDAEGLPATFTNPDSDGNATAPFHLPTTCVPVDPPHQW